MSDKPVMPADMCRTHQQLLITQADYSEDDPWRVLIVIASIALFQAATADRRTHFKIGDDIHRIGELGCLACWKPDAFGEIVKTTKHRNHMKKIKALGEKWVNDAAKK